jgi:diguanylate cyclase (GGDEF)-like protein
LDWVDRETYSIAFFYMFPIGFTTWYAGKGFGQGIALLAALNWTVDNHTHLLAPMIWNSISTLGVFLVTCTLVGKVRSMWESERNHSRRDHLTGLMNSRAFLETLTYEVERFKRGGDPFSLGYIDLDEFKAVNDRYGHQKGDELLRLVADLFRDNLRRTDIIARMGGDEFVIFFPATQGEAIKTVMQKVRKQFLAVMREHRWPTTFSMGVVTFESPPADADEVVLAADRLMYQAKQSGKNRVEFAVSHGDGETYHGTAR